MPKEKKNKRNQVHQNENVGEKSCYWFFECNSRVEFESDVEVAPWTRPVSGLVSFSPLYRLSTPKIKALFMYWKVEETDEICSTEISQETDETKETDWKKKRVTGYIEYEKPVSEAMIINCHGNDFNGKVATKQDRTKPDGYKIQERRKRTRRNLDQIK